MPIVHPALVERWIRGNEPEPKRAKTTPDPEVAAGPLSPFVVEQAAVSSDTVTRRAAAEGGERQLLMDGWASILGELGRKSLLRRRLQADGETLDGSAPSLVAAMAGKSTGTLAKRLCYMRLYRAWLEGLGVGGLPLDEAMLFAYCKHLQDSGAPASRAQAFREAVGFCGGTLGLDVHCAVASKRVQGVALQCLGKRGVLHQRAPLTVAMVMALERLCCDASRGRDAVLAGGLCFTLFARARVGDLRKSLHEPSLDIGSSPAASFIETHLLGHKTARPGTKRALPLVAPALGTTEVMWATAWRDRRVEHKLQGKGVFPTPLVDGSWSEVAQRTTDVGNLLRRLLASAGFAPPTLERIGAHSLKATLLSWAAKRGIEAEARRMLGYHLRPGDRTMAAYSRDELAAPLRMVSDMLAEVRSGKFVPDSSRSGFLVEAPASDESEAASSSAASSEDGVASDMEGAILNVDSGLLHRRGAGDRLECGRPLPLNSRALREWPADQRLCLRCF